MIYFDYAASTPCDPVVLEEMLPYFTDGFANPSNISNELGINAGMAVQLARNGVADFLNCLPQQLIWTSGATESNNLALQGALRFEQYTNATPHIVTSAIEHKSVLETCEQLLYRNATVTFIKPRSNGFVDAEQVQAAIKKDTFLVSIMMANNELGTINDIEAIARVCEKNNLLFHSDATQFFGKMPIDLNKIPIDFLSFSGHKIYAPKGVGGLFVRDPRHLTPVNFGGGQEEGIRPGTLNVPGIIGIAKACQIFSEVQEVESRRLHFLRDKFERLLRAFNTSIIINGLDSLRLPNISNITFPIKEGYNLLHIIGAKKCIACSSGSACDSADNRPSHVMRELGKSRHESKNTLRFSFGRFTTEQEIDLAAAHLISVLQPLVELL